DEHEDFNLDPEERTALTEQARSKINPKVLRSHRFYQFRLAFDRTQAKGSFKVMADEVAQSIEADIILPKSAIKPEYKGGLVRSLRSLLGDQQAHSYRGPLVLGIRDVSRELQFKSSYTVVEHAPEESIELEIERHALEQVEKLQAAARDLDFTERFRAAWDFGGAARDREGRSPRGLRTPVSRTPWSRPVPPLNPRTALISDSATPASSQARQ